MQSKKSLLAWLSNFLNTTLLSIESLGKGVEYCLAIHKLDNSFPIRLLNHAPRSEIDFLKNLKLCQNYFAKNKIVVHFPIERIAKCKLQDNLEFMQWLYKFCSGSSKGVECLKENLLSGNSKQSWEEQMCREGDKNENKIVCDEKIKKFLNDEKVKEYEVVIQMMKNSLSEKDEKIKECINDEKIKEYEVMIQMLKNSLSAKDEKIRECNNDEKIKEYEMLLKSLKNSLSAKDEKIREHEMKIQELKYEKTMEYDMNNGNNLEELRDKIFTLEVNITEKDSYIKQNEDKFNLIMNNLRVELMDKENEIRSLKYEHNENLLKLKLEIENKYLLQSEHNKATVESQSNKLLCLSKENSELKCRINELEGDIIVGIKKYEESEKHLNMFKERFNEKINGVTEIIENLQCERNFYYTRLKEIEMFLKGIDYKDSVCNTILEIMYRKDE